MDELPDDFYSSSFYTDQLISYIDTGNDDGAPFFAYLSFTAPHMPAVVKLPGNMSSAWQDYADSNGVIQPDAPIAYSKPVIGRKY